MGRFKNLTEFLPPFTCFDSSPLSFPFLFNDDDRLRLDLLTSRAFERVARASERNQAKTKRTTLRKSRLRLVQVHSAM